MLISARIFLLNIQEIVSLPRGRNQMNMVSNKTDYMLPINKLIKKKKSRAHPT